MDTMETQHLLKEQFRVIQDEVKGVGQKVDTIGDHVSEIKTKLAVAEAQRGHIESTINEQKVFATALSLKTDKEKEVVGERLDKVDSQISFWRGAITVLYAGFSILILVLIALFNKFVGLK